jgi:hypothetical protein
MTVEQPLVQPPSVIEPEHQLLEPQPEINQPSDNFFGADQPPQEELSPQEEQLIHAEPNADEYERALLASFQQLMGGELEDEKTLSALQEQISIAVNRVTTQQPELLPQAKLDAMSQELVLIRSLRDIGLGLREAKERIDGGTDESLVLGFIKSELSKQPVFYEIFNTHSYEDLLGAVEPYKHTGGVIHDYQFLLKPEVAEVCRKVLDAVKEG